MTVEAPSRLRVSSVVMFLVAIAIVAHGCHGDDVDHEPLIKPPSRVAPINENR